MNWKLELYDLALVGISYMGIEFMRTQSEPVTDWKNWATGVSIGVLYKIIPPGLMLLGNIRERLSGAKS